MELRFKSPVEVIDERHDTIGSTKVEWILHIETRRDEYLKSLDVLIPKQVVEIGGESFTLEDVDVDGADSVTAPLSATALMKFDDGGWVLIFEN